MQMTFLIKSQMYIRSIELSMQLYDCVLSIRFSTVVPAKTDITLELCIYIHRMVKE